MLHKEINIEKNIGIPPRRLNRKYPFSSMEIGDSFFVPSDNQHSTTYFQCRISGTARMWKFLNKSDAVFTVRVVDGGVRCWRQL